MEGKLFSDNPVWQGTLQPGKREVLRVNDGMVLDLTFFSVTLNKFPQGILSVADKLENNGFDRKNQGESQMEAYCDRIDVAATSSQAQALGTVVREPMGT